MAIWREVTQECEEALRIAWACSQMKWGRGARCPRVGSRIGYVTRDEKLREVLRGLAVGLSAEKEEVAIGDSGLRLKLELKKSPEMTWRMQSSKTKFFEHAWLELLDGDGAMLASEGTKKLALGTLKDPERLRQEVVGMADRLVSGGNYNESLASLLRYREQRAKGRLERLEQEAAKIAQAKVDLERATMANGWVTEMANEAALEGFSQEIPELFLTGR